MLNLSPENQGIKTDSGYSTSSAGLLNLSPENQGIKTLGVGLS